MPELWKGYSSFSNLSAHYAPNNMDSGLDYPLCRGNEFVDCLTLLDTHCLGNGVSLDVCREIRVFPQT